MSVAEILSLAAGYAWGLPLVILLIGAGIFFTFRMYGVQLRTFVHAIKVIAGKFDDPKHKGQISHLQALSAALSATVGLGNIAGVAVAVTMGGPGAVFWMWVAGFFGMATKFTTCTLAVMYRKVDERGVTSGGPMYFIRLGLGNKWKIVAAAFALLGAIASFGGGNMFQSNQTAAILFEEYGVPVWLTGIVFAIGVATVIIGGIRRIGAVASKLVPFMAIVYVLGATAIILMNLGEVPDMLWRIVHDAFTGTAAVGGFAGVAFREVLVGGVRRAVFSNEAGLGSAPIAHSAAKTDEPIREGVVAMLGPFIDTILICTMTAVVILLSGLWKDPAVTGGEVTGIRLTVAAFDSGMKGFGRLFVATAVFLFAFSTAISWSYYGEKCTEYLFGEKAVLPYKAIFVICVFMGAIWSLGPVIDFSDTMLALMAVPNLLGTLALSPRVARATKEYLTRLSKGEFYVKAAGGWRSTKVDTSDQDI
ncbi:MAG: amino acid carrier protein [candidate division Zixibacteria bacterium]|nr:amino acid carrier protein [candidate division Zixibacteria bacterium]